MDNAQRAMLEGSAKAVVIALVESNVELLLHFRQVNEELPWKMLSSLVANMYMNLVIVDGKNTEDEIAGFYAKVTKDIREMNTALLSAAPGLTPRDIQAKLSKAGVKVAEERGGEGRGGRGGRGGGRK